MQADDAGDDGMAVETEPPRPVRDVDLAVGADGRDAPVPDHDRLPGGGGAARPVDQLHAGQRDDRVVDFDELADRVGQRRRGLCRDGERSGKDDKRGDQLAHW